MATITTRAGKGSPLTNNEVDANFTNLNTDKAETDGATLTNVDINSGAIDGTAVGATTPSTGDFTTLTENDSPAVVQSDIGTDPDEIPLNQYLGSMAYQDAENVDVDILTVTNQVGIGTKSPGARIEATASGAVVQILNRTTSDGDILQLEKDGTTVGSIGSEGGDALYIQSGTTNGTGLLFTSAGTAIRAARNGVTVDNTLDLGSDTRRFKDLYLSGSVYLGGTTSANALDDYEEGTWTPTLVGTTTPGTGTYSSQFGRYTKIGRVLYYELNIGCNSHTGTGNVRITMPFAGASGINGSAGSGYTGSIDFVSGTAHAAQVSGGSVNLGVFTYGDNISTANITDFVGTWVYSGFYVV